MGSYVFRWPYPADDVHITGTFDDWAKSVPLNRVGDHWEGEVDLPSADEKVLYKFVVDNEWRVDEGAPKEGDGHYNTNNVLMPEFIKRKPAAATKKLGDVPGAFPETPSTEAPSFSVQPIPATSGPGNPISLPAGASVPDSKDITSNTIGSTVTTSKEDYEKAGSSALPTTSKEANEFSINPIPASSGSGNPVSVPAGTELPLQKDITSNTIGSTVTTSKEDYEKAGSSPFPESKTDDQPTFSVNPIPATSGVGNPISVPAGTKLPEQKDITPNTIGSAVTTSKEDYEKAGSSTAIPEASADDPNAFSVKPIPASSGIGNPISLPAGAPIPDQKDITPHTVDSTVTTSKEDYEKAGSSAFPAGIAAGVAAVAAAGGAALGSAFSVPKQKENLIPESSLPMGEAAGKTNTLDSGPFISSSGPGTTTAELASKVPLETGPTIRSSGPGTTTAELASKVPLDNTSSMKSTADAATSKLASELEVPLKSSPFITSSGPGTTTADLAAKVPKENDPFIRSSGPGTTTAELASKVPLENDPVIRSSGPGTTTAALAAGVPLVSQGVPDVVKQSISTSHEAPEAATSSEAVKEKLDLEKELLSKTTPSEATGAPASAAVDQSSYYGLATTVPVAVEKSMQEAHAAPEAASQTSAVAEKSAVEQELLRKVPSAETAGEPAPTITASTSSAAPTSTKPDTSATTTTSTAAAASSLTDGKTANEVVPDTDTSSAAHGLSAGELAGGAAAGGAAAAGVTALAAHHKDAEVEPPHVSDSQKPDVTTEASAASARTPGVSSAAAAALSDGTEDPTLASEPAVKMMKQNEHTTPTAPTTTAAETTATGVSTSDTKEVTGVPALASTGTAMIDGHEKKDVGSSSTAPATSTEPKAPSTPAKKTTTGAGVNSPATSTATSTGTDKKKKRHRFREFIKKVFD